MDIKPVKDEDIKEFLSWKYPEPYEIYNVPDKYLNKEIDELVKDKKDWYVVRKNGLKGIFGFFEFTFGVNDVEIGLGINPSYTSQGYGYKFVKKGISFLRKHYNEYRRDIILRVAEDNKRALKVYKRVGFIEYGRGQMRVYGKDIDYINLVLID